MSLSRLFWRSLLEPWLLKLVVVLCLCFITAASARANEPPSYAGESVAVVTPPKYEPLASAVKQKVSGCTCTAGGVCDCGVGCDCAINTAAPTAEAWELQQVCDGFRCYSVWVKVSAPASAPPKIDAKKPAAPVALSAPVQTCTTVTAPQRAGYRPLERLRDWRENRPRLFGRIRGGCSACGG